MNDTETPAPEKTLPKVRVTPLTVAAVGPLNALIVRKDIEHEGKTRSELFVTIKRSTLKADDEPGMIPLIEVPALVMLLKSIAEPAMSVRSVQPPQPAAPSKKPVKKGRR